MAKSNGIAVLLSLIIPGAGQIYKGRVGRGILWFIGMIFTLMMWTSMGWAIFESSRSFPAFAIVTTLAFGLWVAQVADAYYLKDKEKVSTKADGRRKNAKQK